MIKHPHYLNIFYPRQNNLNMRGSPAFRYNEIHHESVHQYGFADMTHKLLEIFRDYALSRGFAEDAYIVGGAIRDLLLGKENIKDVDIILEENAREIARHFAEISGSAFVVLDEELGCYRVVKEGVFLDLAVMRYKSLSLDLAERDLSINAMALPLISRQEREDALIDPFHGIRDLKRGIVRMISEENFIKDPLRLLRAFRFMATLGFAMEENTQRAVKDLSYLITSMSAERIAEELRIIFATASSYRTVKAMSGSGMLSHVLPESSCGDTAGLLDRYRSVEEMINDPSRCFGDGGDAATAYYTQDFRKAGTKLASLFPSGKALVVAAKRLKLSRRETDYMSALVAYRDDVRSLVRDKRDFSSRDDIRLLKNIRDDLYSLLIHAVAAGACPGASSSHCADLLTFYHGSLKGRMELLPLITGEDLIRELHLTPSPLFGAILEEVEDRTLAGSLASRQEALAFVKDTFSKEITAGKNSAP